MAIHEIRILGDPVLRTEAEAVDAFDGDLEDLVEDMFETMYHAEGIGLAAPQIGVSRRILVVDVRDGEEESGAGRIALVNPKVVESSPDTERSTEGCLSIPGLEEWVERPFAVTVEGWDPEGNEVRIEAGGLLARALQHEIDHLDGILFIDRISPLKRRLLMKKWKKQRQKAEAG